MKRSGRI